MNTTMIPAENLNVLDTIVGYIGNRRIEWPINTVTVRGPKVIVKLSDGHTEYRRNEAVRIQERA